jgi:hypothetical protein
MRAKLIIAVWAFTVACYAMSPWMRNMASYLGDASFAWEYQRGPTNDYLTVGVLLPEGVHEEITLTGWYKHVFTNFNAYVCPILNYTPDEVQYSNPDLLGGALSHGVGGGTNLTGSFSFSGFPYSTYTNHPSVTNTWKWGVYTIDGWSSNSLTINLGGVDYSVGPGTFNRNAIAGGSGDFIVTGTGLASIGVSKTPCHEFFQATFMSLWNTTDLTQQYGGSSSTNGIAFFSIRIKADGTNHVNTLDSKENNRDWITKYTTNACTRMISSGGIYQITMGGIANTTNKTEQLYDVRAYKWRLSDSEIERVYGNGLDDKARRGYN